MGMKVKVGKRRRVKLTLKSYAYPGLTAQRVQAFLVAGLPFLVLGCALLFAHASTVYPGTVVIVWLLLSWAVVWRACTAADRKRLKKAGLKAKVLPTNMPEIKALVAEHCRSVGRKEPATFVLEEEIGRVAVLGGGSPVLVISSHMREVLAPDEFQCALVRAIAEMRTGSYGLKSMIAYSKGLSPLMRTCLFPATFLCTLLEQNWQLLADLTTDRLLLITTRQPRLCLATIMHIEIEANPLAQIEHEDVAAYLHQRTGLKATTDDVHAHFKMGTGLHNVPDLNDRIQALIKYAGSKQFKELCAKIDEAVAKTAR